MAVHDTKPDPGIAVIVPFPGFPVCCFMAPGICLIPVIEMGIVISAHIVVCRTDLEDINKGEPLMGQSLVYEPFKLITLVRVAPCDEACPRTEHQFKGVERVFFYPAGSRTPPVTSR